MQLKARNRWWRNLLRDTPRKKGEPGNSVIESAVRHGNDDRWTDVDSDALTDEEMKLLQKIASPYKKELRAQTLIQKIDLIFGLYQEPLKDKPIRRLEAIVDACRAYFGPMERRWIFHEEDDGTVCAYFVSSVRYTPKRVETRDGERYVYPPYVTLNAKAVERGSETSVSCTWYMEHLEGGKDIITLLNEQEFKPITPWMSKKYDEQLERYHEVVDQLGAQFQAIGIGCQESGDRWYSSYSSISMVREGYPTKVIVDDNESDESDRESGRGGKRRGDAGSKFWRNYDLQRLGHKVRDDDDDDDLFEDEEEVIVDDDDAKAKLEAELDRRTTPPIHPYIRVFDLDKHDFVTIHIDYLQDYPWDETLIDKLILPPETKDLIQILVSGTKDSKEDIIRGKMQGVIVIATGDPGTGKTLTAEVFSETIQKPLYVIQCAQLGTDAGTIETKLSTILKRAQRWQAILLIDEADVYIRARGNDIEQNAIVGVFLRVLEYYRGVLFMTSNRATVIDDAIMSRASAWIRYQMPAAKELAAIWKVLAANYEIALSSKDIQSLIKHLPNLSGRCVRNLLKLTRHLSNARKVKPTEAMIRSVAPFQYLPHHSDDELREAAK